MAWTLDDRFTRNPKILALGGPADRWAWLEILEYAAEHRTRGRIPDAIGDALRRATPALLKRAEEAGLIDRDKDGARVIHDWIAHQGDTVEERVAAYLDDHPDATANEVYRVVRGRRDLVLALVQRYQRGSEPVPDQFPPGSRSGTESVPPAVPDRSCAIAPDRPRAPARSPDARGPDPDPPTSSSGSTDVDPSSSERASAQEPDDDDFEGTEPPDPPADLAHALDGLNPTPNQRARWLLAASTEPDRTRACLTAATRAQKPAAYLDQLIRKGDWPTPHRSEPRPADITPEQKRALLLRGLTAWVTCPEALEYPEPAIRDELERRARRADTTLTPAEEHDLLTAWATARPAATFKKQEPEAA